MMEQKRRCSSKVSALIVNQADAMQIIRKHIALLLVGIFFFPLMFQSLHPLSHLNGQCGHTEQKLCNTPLAVGHDTDFATLNAQAEICPVCQFQFANNELPLLPALVVFLSAKTTPVNESADDLFQDFYEAADSSRAPPLTVA